MQVNLPSTRVDARKQRIHLKLFRKNLDIKFQELTEISPGEFREAGQMLRVCRLTCRHRATNGNRGQEGEVERR